MRHNMMPQPYVNLGWVAFIRDINRASGDLVSLTYAPRPLTQSGGAVGLDVDLDLTAAMRQA